MNGNGNGAAEHSSGKQKQEYGYHSENFNYHVRIIAQILVSCQVEVWDRMGINGHTVRLVNSHTV